MKVCIEWKAHTAANFNIEFKQLEHQIEGDTGQVHCRTTDSEEIAEVRNTVT